MSSVGFNTVSPDKELEKLREAWRSLNDLMRNINSAEQSLKKGDLKLIAAHLKVARWNVEQVRKSIVFVGQAKRDTNRPKSKLAQREHSRWQARFLSRP